MGKSCFTTIKTRTKLRATTQHLSNGNNERPNMRSEAFARDSAEHNVTITTRKEGGALILEELLKNATTPLKGGERRQDTLKIRG